MIRIRLALVAAAVPVTLACAACSGSGHSSSTGASGARPTGSSVSGGTVAAARWWSDAVGGKGSAVDPSGSSADKKLTPSRDVYCTMLKETVAAGKSVLPGATGSDPALATTTEAFVTELQKVAPPSVSGSWNVLGPVLVSVVKSGGALAGLRAHVDAQAVSAAATTVANDARTSCHLELAR